MYRPTARNKLNALKLGFNPFTGFKILFNAFSFALDFIDTLWWCSKFDQYINNNMPSMHMYITRMCGHVSCIQLSTGQESELTMCNNTHEKGY